MKTEKVVYRAVWAAIWVVVVLMILVSPVLPAPLGKINWSFLLLSFCWRWYVEGREWERNHQK